MAVGTAAVLLAGLWPASGLSIALPPDRSFSLVSWNILAPTFAPPSRYPWAPPDVLDWSARSPRIVSALRNMDADVVCLQEVEVSLWGDFFDQLSDLGYDGVLQKTDGNHPIANAVLYRRGVLRCVRSESRSRVLITVLETVDAAVPGTDPLYVANVHLEAGAEKASQRFFQIKSLLRRLQLQRANDVAQTQGRPYALSPAVDVHGAAVVLAGDFNFDRRSALHHLLSTGKLPEDHIQASFGEPAAIVRKGSIPYSHPLLPLTDSYEDCSPPWGPPLRSSYRNGRLLDFIWHSSSVRCLRAMPISTEAGSQQPHRIPSGAHPSDHLPIGALLLWSGAPPARVAAPSWQQMCVESVVSSRSAKRPQGR
jgi:endonuclease/exonuclease/phosphatase family metal-dependent hydrolase